MTPGLQPRALPTELRVGVEGRSRTDDTRIFNPVLYQLSYPHAKADQQIHRGYDGRDGVTGERRDPNG